LCLTEFSESVWCKIPLAGDDLMLIGAVYQSPNSSKVNFGHNEFSFQVNSSATHALVTGDFNMPFIDWNSWTVVCAV